jgi:hypothetical protein
MSNESEHYMGINHNHAIRVKLPSVLLLALLFSTRLDWTAEKMGCIARGTPSNVEKVKLKCRPVTNKAYLSIMLDHHLFFFLPLV